MYKNMRELFRRRLDRLMAQRSKLADEMGVMKRGRFYDIKRFVERPLKQLQKPPKDIKLIDAPSGGVHVDDDYGDGMILEPGQQYVRCGDERVNAPGQGCGAAIPLEEYLRNHSDLPPMRQKTRPGRGGLDKRPGRSRHFS